MSVETKARITTCLWEGCAAPIEQIPGMGRPKKWCDVHRAAKKRTYSTDSLTRECSELECARPVRARDVCNMHYKRILQSEGRGDNRPWDERRKRNQHVRRARKMGATVESVSLSVIAERDGFVCGLCGETVDGSLAYPDPLSKSLDHVLPLSRGGEHSYANCQLAHLRCNVSKGARVA